MPEIRTESMLRCSILAKGLDNLQLLTLSVLGLLASENPTDGGARWAAACGVAKESDTISDIGPPTMMGGKGSVFSLC